ASLPFAILTLVNAPYKRGFYCGDDSIRYPYRPDTITHGLMAGVTITATVVLVSAGEAYLVYTARLYSRSDFNNYVAALYKVLGTFLFGAAVSQSLTDLAKYMIGRLRPNFLAVCDPDWSRVNCSVYVQLERVCRGAPANVTEARFQTWNHPEGDTGHRPGSACLGPGAADWSCCVSEVFEAAGPAQPYLPGDCSMFGPLILRSRWVSMASPTNSAHPLSQALFLLWTLLLWDVLHAVLGGEFLYPLVWGAQGPAFCTALGEVEQVRGKRASGLLRPLGPLRGLSPVALQPADALPPQLYVQARLCGKWARLLRPTVQFFLVAFALYVGYTRVSDHKHHWSDVLVGLLQGALVAGLTVRYVSDFFKARPPRPCLEEVAERKPSLSLTLTVGEASHNHCGYPVSSS
ncbi:Lipid phosphate phosphohydrolase 2, partial [Sciurus carolinensis]|nr:Lipid phosphate phosphohydrolase 2 [Sciurus carolinensis]